MAFVYEVPFTAGMLRLASDYIEANYPEGNEPKELKLLYRAGDAAAMVSAIACGLDLAAIEDPDRQRLAVRAVALKVESMTILSIVANVESAAGGRVLRGFTAGPYSEQYFAPGELAGGGKNTRPPVDAYRPLDEVLWALMDEECREAFIAAATGVQAPAGAVSSFSYRSQPGRY